ncbi:MAG: hypothetical protein FWH43_01005 [Endomicrobia bacterium]|nr:hypothetical protein [Endomicrobiia bacterium]
MIFKKFTAVLTALCFLTAFAGQSFAQSFGQNSGAAVMLEKNNAPIHEIKSDIIAERFGKITEMADYNSPQVIVSIQDLHAHPQTQRNIASILQSLDEKYTIKRVYSEGASGKVDVSWLSSGINSGQKNEIVSQMVENGALTGAEYFAFLNDKDNLFGLEDAKIHYQNIVRLGNIYENEAKNLGIAANVKNEIGYLANKILSPEMKKFSKSSADYRGNKIEAAKYYKTLFDYAEKINAAPQNYYNAFNIGPEEFTELKKVVAIDNMSKKLNAKHINSQLQKYLASIRENMPISQYHKMLEATDNLRDIDMLCKYISEHGTGEKGYSELKAFLELKSLNSRINPLELFAQEQKLEEQIRRSLAADDTEREISFLSRFYPVFEGWLTNKLTAKDEEYFKRNFNDFINLYAKYASVNHINEISGQFAFLNDYYGVNNKRNEIFVRKIDENERLISGGSGKYEAPQKEIYEDIAPKKISPEDIMKSAREIIVIVTGGYHTAGINGILSDKKISHITITPKISESAGMAEINYRQTIIEQSRIYREALSFVIASQTADAGRFKSIVEAGAAFLGKEISFDDLDGLVNEINNITGAEGVLTVDRTDNNAAEIIFSNGARISVSRGANNEITVDAEASRAAETVTAGEIKISEKSLLEAYFDMAKTLVPEALKNIYGVAVLDIENEPVYEMAKAFFLKKAFDGTDMGVDGAIPAAEEYAKATVKRGSTLEETKAALLIDGISYELFSRMPEFFQRAALAKQIEKAEADKKTPRAVRSVLEKIKSMLMIALLMIMFSACSAESSGTPTPYVPPETPGITQTEEYADVRTNSYIRQIAQDFMEGKPLPRSFIGNTSIIQDADQRKIVEEGVVIYDMAVLMKALLLYPEENRDLIEKMFNALEVNKNSNTTNADFTYDDTNIPEGQGYYWKILSTQGAWLENQSQPITGENAWIGNVFVSMSQAYKGSDLGSRAHQRAVELAKAMLALQVESGQWAGAIRMAPRDNISNYEYMGDNYYQTVSVENIVSTYSFLDNLKNFTDDKELKGEIEKALPKLANFLFSMYDKEKGYFLSGVNLQTNVINNIFATDCQTWIISVFGVKDFNAQMEARFGIKNASVEILKRTLGLAGVKENGSYIGLDFTERAQYVSFEWTLGWLAAAKEALLYTDDAELKGAVDSIYAYIRSSQDISGIVNYVNTGRVITAFSWQVTPLPSLASSSWAIFINITVNLGGETVVHPFLIFTNYSSLPENVQLPKPAEEEQPAAPQQAEVQPTEVQQQAREMTMRIDNLQNEGGANWNAYWFSIKTENIEKDGEIAFDIETISAAPGSFARIEMRNLDDNGAPIASSNILLPEKYKIADAGGKTTIVIPQRLFAGLDAKKDLEVVVSVGEDFGGSKLNTQNANITVKEVTIRAAGLELPFVARFLNRLGITKEKYPKLRAGIVSVFEAPIIMFVSPEKFTRMHGLSPASVTEQRLAAAKEMKRKALYFNETIYKGLAIIAAFVALITVMSFLLSGFTAGYLIMLGQCAAYLAIAYIGITVIGNLYVYITNHFRWNLNNPDAAVNSNVQVNIMYVPHIIHAKHLGGKATVDNSGLVSKNVFITNNLFGFDINNFSNSGIKARTARLKTTGEKIPSSRLSEYKPSDIVFTEEPVYVLKNSQEYGIVYYAEDAFYEDIAAAVQNKQFEKLITGALREDGVYLSDKMTADIIEVDTVSEKKQSGFSVSKNLRVYAGDEVYTRPFSAGDYRDHRINRNAEGWQRAKSVRIFLDRITDAEGLERYMKIFSNASNGNIIFTEELALSLGAEGNLALPLLLEQFRRDGISVMVEKTEKAKISGELLNLFDGLFDPVNGKIETVSSVNRGIETFDTDIVKNAENLESSLANAKQDIVLYASALEEYAENDAGLGKILEDLLSIKILKYFESAPITADSARETARNYTVENMNIPALSISPSLLENAYKLLSDGEPAEYILSQFVSGKNFMSEYLTAIEQKVRDEFKDELDVDIEAEIIKIKQAYIEGLLEKFAAALEFKKQERKKGFKDRNAEILIGKLASSKYMAYEAAGEAEVKLVTDRVNEINKSNYRNEIAATVNANPRAVPAVADLMIEMIFAYESEVKINKDDFKKRPNLEAVNAILKAA